MPLRPRKGITRRVSGGGLTTPELENLILGFSFFDEPFKDDEERWRCWEKNRNYIMSLQCEPDKVATGFNRDSFDFLTRPQAWWRYDAPGSRRFISCTNDFCPYFAQCEVAKSIPTESPDCVIRESEDRKGKSSFDCWLKIECVGHHFKIFVPERETEAAFLQRHNLLNEAEKRYIEETKTDNNRP